MPYVRTNKPNGRPKATPIVPIIPAAPRETPEQGTLQETVMLGDAASVNANPATKLRWFATRAEIQQVIARDEVGRAKAVAEAATAAMAGLQEQLKAATDEVTQLKTKLSEIDSQHTIAIHRLQVERDAATGEVSVLCRKISELEPLAAKYTASQSPDANGLGVLAQHEAHEREVQQVKRALLPYDAELAQPSGQWIRLQLQGDARTEYLARESALRHRLTELTETEAEKQLRLTEEAKEQKDRGEAARNYPKIGDTIERDPADLQPIRYVRDRVANEPMPRMPNKLYGYEPIWDGCNMYGTKGQ